MSVINTRLDLGHKVYETLSLLFARYKDPARHAPLNDLVDTQDRYNEAVGALQTLTASRLGIEPTIPSVDNQRRVVNISVLLKEVRLMMFNHMEGSDYTINMPGAVTMMRNLVDYQNYEVLGFVTTPIKQFVLAINSRGQYIFSEKMYWGPAA